MQMNSETNQIVPICSIKIFKQFLKQHAKVILYKNNEKFYGLLKQNLFNDVDFFCDHICEITNNMYFVENGNLFQNSQNNFTWNDQFISMMDFRQELTHAFEKSIVEILS